MDVSVIEEEHREELIGELIENPDSPAVLARILQWNKDGRVKLSGLTLTSLTRRLERAVRRSLRYPGRPLLGTAEKRRERITRGNRGTRRTPERLWKYLKRRFEWNVLNGKVKPGEWLLTVRDVEWLFWELLVDDPRKGRYGKVRLVDLECEVMVKRLADDFSLDGIEVIYRPKRRVTDQPKRKKRAWRRHTVLWSSLW